MYGIEKTDRLGVAHKKGSANRVTRDECDISKLLACFASSAMTHAFADDTGELANFVTRVVLPSSIAKKLLASTDKGREEMKAFVFKYR